MNKLPKAKSDNIVVNALKDEVLIYDLTTNQAFCLNSTSANVFNACDGKMTFAELKAKYNYTDEIVYLALDGLKKKNLIVDEYASPFGEMNRREMVRKVGLASMIALPVISSIVAPAAAQAASGSMTCTIGGCIPAGQELCAGCGGNTVVFDLYDPGTGCSGAIRFTDFSNLCPPNGMIGFSSFDRVRKSFT